MTPSPNGTPIMGGGRQRSRFPKYRTNQQPGNEPGGANGHYGRFGQMPGMQPSSGFDGAVDSMKKGFAAAQSGQPGAAAGSLAQGVGDFAGAIKQRYGQRQVNQGVNAMQDRMRGEGMANGMGSMQRHNQQADTMPGQNAEGAQRQASAQTSPFGGGAAPFSQQQPAQDAPQQGAQPDEQGMSGVSGGSSTSNQQAAGDMNSGMTQAAQPPKQAPAPQASFSSPFGNMRFGAPQAMETGGMVSEPTLALLGENGPEAVVPMGGNPNAKITPGMMESRDTFNTGPSSLGKPLHGLAPTSGPMANQKFPRYGA